MLFGILTLLVALTISGVAIYYSVAGLVAIFAAAAIPIIIMGGALEIGKLVAAVWLHRYWDKARWWLRLYLAVAVLVLMFITSMGIFGFLSKAHIEQASAATEQVATIQRYNDEIGREQEIIARAEQRIAKAETDATAEDVGIQEKIDKEQQRIDSAYTRRQPSIREQLDIIEAQELALDERVAVFEDEIVSLDTEISRLNGLVSEYRTELSNTSVASVEEQIQPYRDQITQLDSDIARLDEQAASYEVRISDLVPDYSAVDTLKDQITAIEQSIVVTTNKLQSTERAKVKEGQAVIGVTSDGLFGSNTTRALNAWVTAQQTRIADLQSQETELRAQAQLVISTERTRLTGLVTGLRGTQTESVQQRKQGLLDTIDTIRTDAASNLQTARSNIQTKIDLVLDTDIPAVRDQRKLAQESITQLRNSPDRKIENAQAEMARLRELAEAEIAQSQSVIARLRNEIQIGDDVDLDVLTDTQLARIKTANDNIDRITNQKFALQAEARKLEAEVGPVKYLAEFIYEDADRTTLEDAVRWVILIIIFVFDPLAVALLIAAQYIFEWRREERNGRTTKLTNRSVQDDNVEPNERNGKANDEASVPKRSTVETVKEPVLDSASDELATLLEKAEPEVLEQVAKELEGWEKTAAGSSGMPNPGKNKLDKVEYNPYTDTRPTKELNKEEQTIRDTAWPEGYDGKLVPPKPFKED